MSEIDEAHVTPQKKSSIKILFIVLSGLIVLLVYGIGIVVLPTSILRNYQNKDCDSALFLNTLYTDVYPGFLQQASLFVQVRECEAYVLAASNEEMGLWQDAYDAYQLYSTTYPNGLYAREAHEHSAIVLMNIVKEQTEQKKYDEAITSLNKIMSSYSDTSVSAEASALIPSVYTSAGARLRAAKDFAKAEQVFNDLKAWVETNQKNEFAESVTSELAQTYVAWGQDLQSRKQFENALGKYAMAVTSDPEPGLDSGSAGQARSGQRKIYIEWGNDLLKQNQISAAMEKFERAVSLVEGDEDDGARDALANGHILWASSLRADDDFWGALEQLQIAKGTAVSGEIKKSADTEWGETYEAFSNSTGAQAQRAMEDAVKTVCEKNQKPELPIFGLNKDSVRVGIYGLDVQLPENLVAKTPAEMHYVACVDQEKKTVDSKYIPYGLPKPPSGNYKVKKLGNTYNVSVLEHRVELIWNVSLRKANTIEEVFTASIPGGAPPKYPTDWAAVGDGYLYGKPPDALLLIQWLQAHVK